MKRCLRCNRDLVFDAFSRDVSRRGGLSAYCRECMAAYRKAYAAAHPEQLRERRRIYRETHVAHIQVKRAAHYRANRQAILDADREYRRANREKTRETKRMWRERNPGRTAVFNGRWVAANEERAALIHRAQARVAHALKLGLLKRPAACDECGASGVVIEAAHADYTRPLDVRWLCRPCHRRWDAAQPKTVAARESAHHGHEAAADAVMRTADENAYAIGSRGSWRLRGIV